MVKKSAITYEAERDPAFAKWVSTVPGGEDIKRCIQCGTCSSACPLAQHMDYTPRQLMYLAKEGFRDQVLRSATPWLCASCYACTVSCPKHIKITDVMYALKRRAIQDHVYPPHSPVPVLAKEFQKMVHDGGRTNEGLLVFRLLLKTGLLKGVSMAGLGWRLLRTGRMSVRGESMKNRAELQGILDKMDRRTEDAA